MQNSNVRSILLNMVVWLAAAVTAPELFRASAQMSGMNMEKAADAGAHQDHDPKHGGIFFMAMDEKHHLEGVLEQTRTFRVYLYDDHTRPLAKDKMKDVSGTVQLGDSEDAPKLPLAMSKDGKTLELALPPGTKPPVTLTLLLRFPGLGAEARPELFTFPFNDFTGAKGGQNHSGGAM